MEIKKYDIELRSNYATTKFVLGFPFSNAISLIVCVEANNLQEAMDILADHLQENDIYPLFWSSYEQISDELDSDYASVDEYTEANNMICCGNTGIYIDCPTLISETPVEDNRIFINGNLMSTDDFIKELRNIKQNISDEDISEAIYYAQSCEHESVRDALDDSIYDRME